MDLQKKFEKETGEEPYYHITREITVFNVNYLSWIIHFVQRRPRNLTSLLMQELEEIELEAETVTENHWHTEAAKAIREYLGVSKCNSI